MVHFWTRMRCAATAKLSRSPRQMVSVSHHVGPCRTKWQQLCEGAAERATHGGIEHAVRSKDQVEWAVCALYVGGVFRHAPRKQPAHTLPACLACRLRDTACCHCTCAAVSVRSLQRRTTRATRLGSHPATQLQHALPADAAGAAAQGQQVGASTTAHPLI